MSFVGNEDRATEPLHKRAKLARHCRDHDLPPSGHGMSESKAGSKIRSVENLDVEHREVLKEKGGVRREKGVEIGECHVLRSQSTTVFHLLHQSIRCLNVIIAHQFF
jgi:hypothetical protein